MPETLLATPLHAAHLKAQARMAPYAGYEMPVQYGSVIAEAKAVREGAGMFDVSHMARLRLTPEEGPTQSCPQIVAYLEQITTNDIAKLEPMRGQYSLLANKMGGLVDDIIVYRHPLNFFRIVANALNHEKDVAWMESENTFGVSIHDETDATAMIAVQGPRAVEILASIASPLVERGSHAAPADKEAERAILGNTPAFGFLGRRFGGVECFAARTGYTGEDGYELICQAEQAETLWNALLNAGAAPCGLAARDILRVEAGLPLYGHELGEDMNPIAAGLGWVVGKTKAFNSSSYFNEAREQGTKLKLRGVKLDGRRVASPEAPVFVDGREVGKVSSGVYSPLLDCGLALAFLDSSVGPGAPCEIEIRGKREPGLIVGKRFLQEAKRGM